jgi:hypothetical protein
MESEQQSPEKILKSREVFTDDVEVIGGNDEAECLEALPLYCAIMTMANPDKKTVGMAHFSLGLEQEGVQNLVNQLQHKLLGYGLKISDCQIRLLNAGNILSAEIKVELTSRKIAFPNSEMMEAEGIRINRNTGEVTFFSLIPKEPED